MRRMMRRLQATEHPAALVAIALTTLLLLAGLSIPRSTIRAAGAAASALLPQAAGCADGVSGLLPRCRGAGGPPVVIADGAGLAAKSPPLEPILAVSPYVAVSDTGFLLDGRKFYPSGTNWYDLLKAENYSPAAIRRSLRMHWANGVRVLRVFGHINGFGGGDEELSDFPFQPSLGIFNETNLRHYDLVLDELSKVGIRVILTLANYHPSLGSIKWYVNSVANASKPTLAALDSLADSLANSTGAADSAAAELGRAKLRSTDGGGNGSNDTALAPELFYTDPRVRAAYKLWVRTITQRVNTLNGRTYSQDPTIFAWDLCNECHTSMDYELQRKIPPGTLVHNWLVEMSAYLKTGLQVRQLVADGNDGYRSRGVFDPDAPVEDPFQNSTIGAHQGEDFARTLTIPTLDYVTTHIYPDHLSVPPYAFQWVNDNWLGIRQALAAAARKPLLLEEVGCPNAYEASRDAVLGSVLGAAHHYGVAGTLVWSLYTYAPPQLLPDGADPLDPFQGSNYYFFNYSQPGSATAQQEFAYQLARPTAASKGSTAPPPFAYAPFKYGVCTGGCTDAPPTKQLNCTQEAQQGSCGTDAFIRGSATHPEGFCQISCGRCSCLLLDTPLPGCDCTNGAPDTQYTCADQLSFEKDAGGPGSKCCADFMLEGDRLHPGGFCEITCGRCRCAPSGAAIDCVNGTELQLKPSKSGGSAPQQPTAAVLAGICAAAATALLWS